MNLADDDTHLSKIQVLKSFDLPAMTDYITQKRMRWVGHALTRNDNDKSKKVVLTTLGIDSSPWTKLVQGDCSKLNISMNKLLESAMDRPLFRRITWWRTL